MKIFKLLVIFLLVPCFLWAAQGIRVTWDANTETDLAGYKVLFAKPGDVGWVSSGDTITYSLGSFPNITELITATQYDILYGDGPYAVAVIAVDTAGNESALSSIVSIEVKDPSIPAVVEVPPINIAPSVPTQIIINIIQE
mgnify:FL=1